MSSMASPLYEDSGGRCALYARKRRDTDPKAPRSKVKLVSIVFNLTLCCSF